jgi:hypothetical protein
MSEVYVYTQKQELCLSDAPRLQRAQNAERHHGHRHGLCGAALARRSPLRARRVTPGALG